MTEIKPVFYVDATTLRCRTMDDISDESVLYYRRGDKVHETDVALYPAAAYEALQTEVTRLQREVVNRNQRALDGDKAIKTQDTLLVEIEALQKENHDLRYLNLSSMTDLQIKNRDLESNNAAQAKRITEQLEAIEATAEFAKAFWEKADKHRDTRVMVSTFQQLEQKLRTYLSKNGE